MTKYLDNEWFDELLKATAPVEETFNLLMPKPETLTLRRREFEASGYSLPVDLFPDRDIERTLRQPARDLMALRHSIDIDETNPVVRETYFNYIDDLLDNILLIGAACRKDAAEYARMNEKLYGQPDHQIFDDVCAWLRHDISPSATSENSTLVKLANDLLQLIPSTTGDWQRLVPSREAFDLVRRHHFQPGGFFDQLFGRQGLPKSPYIDQTEGDEICWRVLQNIGAGYRIIDSPTNTWAVSREPRQLIRPLNYRMSNEEFIGLIGHEIGSHILESVNGAKLPLKLMEMGLAGYLNGNEGRALIREQIVYPDIEAAMRQPRAIQQPSWEFNIMKHLAVCLAVGYGGRPYNFAEVYNVIYLLYRFWRERRLPGSESNEAYAREQAWFLTARITKGTDGRGGCYFKDIVYLEGNVKMWRMAANDPDLIMLGDHGKFNLLDPRHRQIIEQLQA